MRIIHYPKLIEQEKSQPFSLRNCSVVIDGQNYLHYMYEKSRIPFIFGCETAKYAEYLKKQFKMFKQANVKCYIVFKGGDTDIEQKIKTFRYEFFDFETNSIFVPPILLKDATVQVIDEMGIDYAFCVTESKDECVALALKLECPVVAYDVQYCFKKAPYIPSSTMKYDERTKSILCRRYKLQEFLKNNSLTEEKTAIFVSLTDSCVLPFTFFDSLLETWGIQIDPQYIKLKYLIKWLAKHSEHEARDGISKKLTNDEESSTFWFNYHKILTNMRNDAPGHVTEYLLKSELPIVPHDTEWFEKGVVCKHVPPVYINLYKWKVLEGSSAFDEKTGDTIFLSMDIIKYAFNLLTNYSGETFRVYKDANNYTEVTTDDSNRPAVTYNYQVSVFENGWDQVRDLRLFEHFMMAKHLIDTEDLAKKLKPDCVVLFAALTYFERKKVIEGKNVTKEVYAVLLSYVLQNMVISTETSSKDWKDHIKVKCVAAKYFQYDDIETKRIYDGQLYRSIIELQFCIQHMNYLNTLCGSPYESVKYRKIYNGTLIYKIFYDMLEKDPVNFKNELFQMDPSVMAEVDHLLEVFVNATAEQEVSASIPGSNTNEAIARIGLD